MSPEERAREILSDARCFCVEHRTDFCVVCATRAVLAAEDDALERAAQHAERGFILVPRDVPWMEQRRVIADSIRSLKSGRTPGGGER